LIREEYPDLDSRDPSPVLPRWTGHGLAPYPFLHMERLDPGLVIKVIINFLLKEES